MAILTIAAPVRAVRTQADYVFTTGGNGPTHDDKTAEAMARAFDTKLERHAEAWARLEAHYGGLENINAGRAKMADIPVGATLFDNPVSTAPGFILDNVYVMAGVPRIMQAMMEGLLPKLEGGAVIHSRSVSADIAESTLAEGLAAIEAAHAGVSVGSYPKFTPNMKPHTTIVVRGTELPVVESALAQVAALMRDKGAEPVMP